MVEELIGLRGELTTDVLLNECVVELPFKQLCLYPWTSAALSLAASEEWLNAETGNWST